MGITVGGIVSGIDVDKIVEQITEIERKPAEKLTKQKESYNVLISSYGSLQQELSHLNAASRDLRYPSSFNHHKATGGDPDSYTMSAGRFARNGSYSVEVHQLAASEKLASGAFDAEEKPGAGTLSIQIGDGDPMEIKVGANFTLNDLANAINAEKGDVSAGVISDGEHQYFTFSSTLTGAANTIQVLVTEDADGDTSDASGLSALVTSRAEEKEGEEPLPQKALRVTQKAQDAILTVDGITGIHRSENTITDVIKDVTLTLTRPNGPSSFTVSVDNQGLTEKLGSFVENFNNLLTFFHETQKYNGQGEKQGSLFGDQSANRIKSSLMRLSSAPMGDGETLRGISDIGITVSRVLDRQDPEFGKVYFELDEAKLAKANKENPEELKRFFTNTEEGKEGLAVKIGNLISGFNAPATGILSSSSDSIKGKVKSLDKQINRVEEKADRSEGRLRKRFNSLEKVLAEYKATGDQLSGQLTGIANINRQASNR